MTSIFDDLEVYRLHTNGRPHTGRLKRAATIDGIPCAEGLVHLHENGALEYATIARAHEIQEWRLEENDNVWRRPDGTIEQLLFVRPRSVLGRDDVRGLRLDERGAPAELDRDDGCFSPSGALIRRSLGDRVEIIGGVACTGPTLFHPNGVLRMTFLASPLATPFGEIPPGSIVTFDESGALRRATVEAPCTLGDRVFEQGASVRFTDAGVTAADWSFRTGFDTRGSE